MWGNKILKRISLEQTDLYNAIQTNVGSVSDLFVNNFKAFMQPYHIATLVLEVALLVKSTQIMKGI